MIDDWLSFPGARSHPEVDTETPLPTLVQMAPEGDPEEAGLDEVLEYLLRSKHLALPMEWLDVFQ